MSDSPADPSDEPTEQSDESSKSSDEPTEQADEQPEQSDHPADVGRREKVAALRRAASHDPALAAAIVAASFLTAVLEGIGIGYILPIVEYAEPSGETGDALAYFERAYELVGVPFTLETVVGGLIAVVLLRFVASFVVRYLRAMLDADYQRALRRDLFEALADAPVEYVDEAGSDELLNSLVTETDRAASIVTTMVDVVETGLRGAIFLAVAVLVSPLMTLLAVVGFATSTLLSRVVLESAYDVGDRVADANEEIQTISQAGIQGTRDVRLFTVREELVDRMRTTLDEFYVASVRLLRNQATMHSANRFLNTVVVFALVYVGIATVELGAGELGVFLFAVFRLAPVAAQLNDGLYDVDGTLPHLVRVTARIDELEDRTAPGASGDRPVSSVDRIDVEDVSFAYDERVLDGVSLHVERGERVALVGQSGAGKSTIVSLLARFREPDAGRILADGTPIGELDVEQWRERLAVVRQDPYVFDQTLRENLTVGNREATRAEIERACERAQVTEFLDDLPDGYDTLVGEDGVRLSGGQRQRVAIARALLKDADVLVLDEATSELDSTIEREVQRAVAEETSYATISIAHRLSTVRDADRIYVLVEGAVAEVGTHEELLDRQGVYADLHATQVGERALDARE